MEYDSDITTGAAILYSGTVSSTLGYALMLTTTILFPAWRRSPVNQIWLYMCGCQLTWAYVDTVYYLWFYEQISSPWLDNDIGFVVHVFFGNYFFLASCGWMVAGSWLARKHVVKASYDSKFMIKASIFAWLSPLPTSVTAAVVANDAIKWNYILIFIAKGHVHIWLAILGSVCIYARVLFSAWRSAKDSGRQRDIVGTTSLALVFVLTSGVQYTVLFIYKYVPDSAVNKAALLQLKFFVISYNVCIYSLLFIAGIKQTRLLWLDYLGKKVGRREELIVSDA